jgi:antitoxin (DNA-binding transcriptional repressor) of toxin-antitoxin stability system
MIVMRALVFISAGSRFKDEFELSYAKLERHKKWRRIMSPYSLQDAQTHLKDLIQAALQGKTVWIADEQGMIVQLTPVLPGSMISPRKAGSAAGLVTMSHDFDGRKS